MTRHKLIATALALVLGGAALAAEVPVQQNNSNAVWFENWIGLSNATMRIASPDGDITDISSEKGTPVFTLTPPASDGVYRYELRAQTDEMVKNRNRLPANMGGDDSEYIPKSYYKTGHFVVERGVILRPEDIETEEEN